MYLDKWRPIAKQTEDFVLQVLSFGVNNNFAPSISISQTYEYDNRLNDAYRFLKGSDALQVDYCSTFEERDYILRLHALNVLKMFELVNQGISDNLWVSCSSKLLHKDFWPNLNNVFNHYLAIMMKYAEESFPTHYEEYKNEDMKKAFPRERQLEMYKFSIIHKSFMLKEINDLLRFTKDHYSLFHYFYYCKPEYKGMIHNFDAMKKAYKRSEYILKLQCNRK